jgi:hypothetical protein
MEKDDFYISPALLNDYLAAEKLPKVSLSLLGIWREGKQITKFSKKLNDLYLYEIGPKLTEGVDFIYKKRGGREFSYYSMKGFEAIKDLILKRERKFYFSGEN